MFMKKMLVYSLALGVVAINLYAIDGIDKVAYGEDNRILISQAVPAIQEVARSTAAMIPLEIMEESYFGLLFKVKNKKITQSMNLCPDELFSNLINPANCSGFLVGEDLLVTAGHCVKSMQDCNHYRWVFDFKNELLSQNNEIYLNADNVYKCQEIISRSLDSATMSDYALIRLNRPVLGGTPLKIRKSGKVSDDASVLVIGQPSGLPTIVSDHAIVRKNDNDFFFVTNLDTFGGNSGSAVFNTQTLEVEGILVRGENDYVLDEARGCMKVNNCKEDECRGEDVTRITVIPGL